MYIYYLVEHEFLQKFQMIFHPKFCFSQSNRQCRGHIIIAVQIASISFEQHKTKIRKFLISVHKKYPVLGAQIQYTYVPNENNSIFLFFEGLFISNFPLFVFYSFFSDQYPITKHGPILIDSCVTSRITKFGSKFETSLLDFFRVKIF